jgi:hypothetical protein
MAQDDDLLPHDPDESHYKPISHVSVGDTGNLDFTLSLRTADDGIFRFRLTPKLACEILAWFPFVACEQAKRVNLAPTSAPRQFVPIRVTQVSAEAGQTPGEALLIFDAGQLTLGMAVDLESLRGLQKWIDQMLRFVPQAGGESKH